jgi:hypothetical protein
MKFFTNALWVFLTLFICTKPTLAQSQIEFDTAGAAQRSERLFFKEAQGYYTLGFHGGYSYQSSDVSNLYKGWGLALTLEKNLIHKQGDFLDLGVRGRAMYANSFGLNTRPFTGKIDYNFAVNGKYNPNANYLSDSVYYANYRNDFGELGLEGVLTFNRLRETKGILLSLYGGFGLDFYYVGTDQTNANDAKYAYKTINPNQSVATIRQQLTAMRDGTFETSGDSFDGNLQVGLMPNVGIELGYQLHPKVSIGIGHRLMFTQTNLFDGQQWEDDNTISPRNDLHHFTSLDLKFIVSNKKNQLKPPQITITRPEQNPYRTYNTTELLQARITGIETGADVTFKVNGVVKPFNYYNKWFDATVDIQDVSNECVLTARNQAGIVTEKIIFIKNVKVVKPTQTGNPVPTPTPIPVPKPDPINTTPTVIAPSVQITSPSSISVTEASAIDFRATTQHIERKDQVTLTLNNYPITNFNFYNNFVSTALNLKEGSNNIVITVRNSAGQATDRYVVTLNRPQPVPTPVPVPVPTETPRPLPPGVSVRMESFVKGNEMGCENDWYATLRNVANRNDIRVYLNGSPMDNWTYTPNRISGQARLRSGVNRISVEVKNTVGSATGEGVSSCDTESPRAAFPAVRLSVEGNVQGDNNGCRTAFSATTQHVRSKSDITVYLNGNTLYDWTFDERSGMMRGNLNLKLGNNLFRIIVRNESGEARDETDIYCNAKKSPPSVRFTRPYEGTRTTQPEVAVEATVLNTLRGGIILKINNVHVNNFEFDENSRTLRVTIPLTVGVNTIRLTAQNPDGNDEAQLAVIRNEEIREKRPPRVTITAPQNNSSVTVPEGVVKAALLNISNENQVIMYVNNAKFEGYKIDKLFRNITAKVPLREGNNLITVRVENEDGNNQASVSVAYTMAQPPVVRITTPADGASFEIPNGVLVKANLENVNGKEGVRAYLNGVSVAFSVINNVLTMPCNLQAGDNTVRIAVSNAGGNAEDRIKLVWNRPAPPTAMILNPPAKSNILESTSLDFEGNVTNADKSGVTLLLNGNSISNFSLENSHVTAKMNLRVGKNVIVLSATGKGGTATAEAIASVVTPTEEVVLPDRTSPVAGVSVANLVVSRPAIDPLDPRPVQSTLTTILTGVQPSDISLIINGINITDFQFNVKSGMLSYTFPVQGGQSYRIQVLAANKTGKAERDETVRF